MSKTVKRLIPVSLYDIAGIETWLSSLSSQGLLFEKFGTYFAYFRRCESCEKIYRLEPSTHSGDPAAEMLEFYHQNGWEYVTAFNRLFYVFRASPGTLEIHSDSVTQGYAFERLNQNLRNSAIFVGVAIVLILGFISGVFLFSDWPMLELVGGSAAAVNYLLLFLVELGLLVQSVQSYRAIHRLMKRLKAGLPMEHHGDYRKRQRRLILFHSFLSVIVVCSLMISISSLVLRSESSLSQFEDPLPLLPLGAVEQDPAFSYHSELYEGKDRDNCVRSEWNPLAPVQYRIDQRGIVPGKEWPDQSGVYSPSMRIRYFRFSLPLLADPLMNDLIYRYTVHHYQSDELKRVELSEPGLDRAELFYGQGRQVLFARSGNQVVMLQYYGMESLERHAADLSQILASWDA